MRLIDADVLKEDLGRIITACKRRYSYKEIGFNLTQLDYIMTRIIDETPTIPPENLQPQWIPVTKRLPELCEAEQEIECEIPQSSRWLDTV